MIKKAVALLTALLLLVGCSLHKSSPPSTKPPIAPPATAPLTLAVEPASASPGQSVTLTLRADKPGLVRADKPGMNGLIAYTCFDSCKLGRWTSVTLAAASSDGTLYTGQFEIPLFLPDSSGSPLPLSAGGHQLSMACLTSEQKGCVDQPDVIVSVQVTTQSTAAAWTSLPLGQTATKPSPLLTVGGFYTTAVDPVDPLHSVTCVTGAPNPNDWPDIPRLEVTRDGGKTKGRISLVNSPFQGQHGIVGCRTVALDPQHPDSFYAEDSGSTALRTMPPYVTLDHGETWQPVPMPVSLQGDAGASFRGFSMTLTGVTAWFSTAAFDRPLVASEQIAGHLTTDGGRTWQKVPLTCSSPNCLAQVNTGFLLGQNGLIRSTDQGKNWDWVRYAGSPIAAVSFYSLGNGAQTLLAANTAVAKQYIPLLYSADGGQNWQAVQLPGLPGGWVQDAASPLWDFPTLSLQPDGSLLAHRWSGQPENKDWYQLQPGGRQWEAVPPPAESKP